MEKKLKINVEEEKDLVVNEEEYEYEDVDYEYEEYDEDDLYYEEYDGSEEYEDENEEVVETEGILITCNSDSSIDFINEVIRNFKTEEEKEVNSIINPNILAHLLNIELDTYKLIDFKTLLNELASLSGFTVTELKNDYLKRIKRQIKEEERNIALAEDPNSPFRFYGEGMHGKMEFKAGLVGEEILEEEHFLHEDGNIYVYINGFYQRKAYERIDYLIKEKLGVNEYNKNRHESVKSYVLSDIKLESNCDDVMQDEKQSNLLQRYINLENGLLDWKKMKLIPHTPKLYSKNQFPIKFNPKANKEFTENFLKQVLPKDSIGTILEYIGYSMTTKMNKQVALMLTGNGSNGKSVFLEYIGNMIGGNNVSSITLKDFDGNRFKLANLKDKLINIGADISSKRLDETEVFKKMVSGDKMSAEFKGENSFEFTPYAKHYYSANELPQTVDSTKGFFRRWMIVPFMADFEGKEDPRIFDKIKKRENLEGFFLLALDGLRRLEKQGTFSESKTMDNMLEIYKDDNKPVKRFIEEQCTLVKENTGENYVRLDDLYEEYKEWCEKMSMGTKKYTNFYKDLYRDFPQLKEKKKRIRIDGERTYVLEGLILGLEEDIIEENESKIIDIVSKIKQ